MNSFYRKKIEEAKEAVDSQIVRSNGINDHAMYKYLVGKSAGLFAALEILENGQVERSNDS